MAGNIIVIVIVCLAAFFIGKRIYKIASGRQMDCGCESGKGCESCQINEGPGSGSGD